MNVDESIADVLTWIREDREREHLAPVELTPETALLAERIFDSMKVLEFVLWLESRFGVTIGPDHLTPAFFSSPRAVVAGVLQLHAAAQRHSS